MTVAEMTLLAGVAMGGLALLYSLWAQASSRREIASLRLYCQRLERELAGANSASIGMGQRLIALEKRLLNGEQQAAPRALDNGDYPYSQASQLFEQGLEVDEVARRCGLSRAEASLLEAMQNQGRAVYS